MYIYKDKTLKKHWGGEIPQGWKETTYEEHLARMTPRPPINPKKARSKHRIKIIERELERLSNLYIAKTQVFKEWEETDQRAQDILSQRNLLRQEHDTLKGVIDND